MGVLQDAVLQHGLAAGKAQGVGSLLVRLEHQLHAAVQFALVLLQQLRRAQQHGGVQVVAAGVGRVALGGKGKAGLLLHGQGVHVRPQQDGLAARLAQGGHNARFAHAPGLIAQLPQFFFHKGAGLGQLKAHLRVAVQPAAIFHQLRLQFFCAFQQFVHHSFASQRMCSAPFFTARKLFVEKGCFFRTHVIESVHGINSMNSFYKIFLPLSTAFFARRGKGPPNDRKEQFL